jgi:hypothetical protein
MKKHVWEEIQLHHSLPRHQMAMSGQVHTLAALPPRKEPPGTHWIGDWVGSGISVDSAE